ncbi:MAG: lamin tail domain-containing protein, partial [Kiritimatiellae bacterium]|nr:lamin tail domain-containing protein [Kiritimatiellia bacterium]
MMPPLPFRRFLSAASIAAGAVFLPLAARAVPVRIASFNICNASGAEKLAAISNILQRVRPDILALEEATTGQEAAYTTLFASLGNPLPHHVFMPNPGSGRGTQSDKLAIYSRWPIVSSTIVKETDSDPDAVEFMRWPLHAVVEVEGALNPLHVIALHAAATTVSTPRRIWRGLETERVASFIERHILAADPNATEYVVLGDFNDSADGRRGSDNAATFQPASFSYETFRKYETNGTFSTPFRLGSDAAWHSNNASRASHTMLYRTYPNERLGDMSAVTAYRTGSDDDWTTCLDGDVYRLDYILFSDEIAHSSYGAPEGEAYYSPADREYDLGLDKPGDFAAVDPAASTNASDHLLLFADFNMIDEIGGITPVAILSEVVHCATNGSATFVEICNTGADELDLDGYTLELYLNGAAKYSYRKSFSDVVLDAGGTYWIAGNKASASNVWGRVPDATWTSLKSLDGNDTVVLRNPSGAIQDIYGAVGVDGTSQAWYHEDTAAIRRAGVTDPRSGWDAAEWDLRPSSEATPGAHQALLEADVTLSTPQIRASGRDSTAPTAAEAFSFTVTATANTLASNLAASAVFRINGGIWLTNAMTLADPDGTLWQSDALDVARTGGSVADFFVTVSFDGPGDLSPAGSAVQTYTFPGAASATELPDVLLNEVKTAGSGAFAELAGGAGVDVSGWSLALFDTNAEAVWTYRIPDGTTIPDDNVRDMWGNAAGFLVLAGDAAVANADLVLAGCDDGGSLFSATEPRVLVLANNAGGVVDAVAWIETDAFESIVMPDALSTSVPRGAGNFLHCLGAPATGGNSLQAPDNVRVGTQSESVYAMPAWDSAPATPGAANVSQTDGALVLARVDRDGDGLLDDEDNCPTSFNPAQGDIDDDGIGDECDADMDGDGIPNAIDNCPTEPNPLQEDFDADGIGNVCAPDFDEEATSGRYETLHVTFENLAAGASGTFEEGGRNWQMTGAVAGADDADCKLAEKAMRAAPGAILELDGFLTNRLNVVGFFFGPYGGAAGTPDVAIELTEDGVDWREFARVATAGATELTRAVVAIDDAPAGARFRLRVLGSGSAPCLDLDNLLLVSLVRQTAVVTLDSPLAVAYDGAVHTNEFTVLPAGAAWQATYATEGGEPTASPVEVGTYTATVAVEDDDAVAGGTFAFPHSLAILETLPDPEIVSCTAEPGAVAATLHAVVKPNRADGESLLATFEYGTGTNFGSKVVAEGSPVGGLAETEISAALAGLSPNTLYYWRANVGDVSGATRTFATETLAAPGVAASEVRATGFTLSWPALQGAEDYLLDVRLGEATATEIAERFWNWSSSTSAGTTPTAVEGEGGTWSIVNASVYMGDESGIGSSNVVYLRNKSNSWWSSGTGTYGSLDTPAWEGIREISFVVRRASGTGGNASGTLKLQRSDDDGSTWEDLATYQVARSVSSNRYAFAAVPTNAVKLRFCNTGSYGIYVHDVFATLAGGAASVAGFPAACTGNTCRVTGLAPETTYAVLAKVEYPGSIASAWSDAIAVTTVTRPAPPVLAAAPAAGTSLSFSWNAVAGAETYLLQLAPDADFAPAVARVAEGFEGNATNADNTVTTSNGWLAAVSGANCGINTSATTGMTGTGNRIRWTKTSTATATIAIPVPDGATARIASLDWWAASDAPGGTALFWGTDAAGCTNLASDFTETTGTGTWESRSGIALGPVPGGTLFLAFAKTGTGSLFGIDNIVLETSEPVRAIETAETEATVEHLPARTTYFARVSADGGETWSGTVETETGEGELPVPGVPALSVGEETADGFTVSWEPVEDATSYKLEWSRDGSFSGGPADIHADFEEGIPEGWTVGHASGTTAPTVISNASYAAEGTTNALRLTGAGRYVQTPLLAAPETLSFHYCVPTAGDWALAVQVAETEDFADPVTVDTLEVTNTVPAATRHEVDLGAYSNVFVRLLDVRPEGTKYRFLDEIAVSQKTEGEVFRAETEETSYAVGELGSGETWFVRAAAANAGATGEWSEPVTARTLVATAAVTVTLDPPEARWTLLGTNHASGETVEGLDAGDYEIGFLPCDGYRTPGAVTVPLAPGTTETLQVAYEKTVFLDAPVLSVANETHDGFTVSWDAVPDATRYDLEWSRFSSFAGKGDDLLADFEDGAVPDGWSVGHTNANTGFPAVYANAAYAACGSTNALRFDSPKPGAYCASPLLPSPGALSYWYCVPNKNPWALETQVAHESDFSDAVTVDTLATTSSVLPAVQRT